MEKKGFNPPNNIGGVRQADGETECDAQEIADEFDNRITGGGFTNDNDKGDEKALTDLGVYEENMVSYGSPWDWPKLVYRQSGGLGDGHHPERSGPCDQVTNLLEIWMEAADVFSADELLQVIGFSVMKERILLLTARQKILKDFLSSLDVVCDSLEWAWISIWASYGADHGLSQGCSVAGSPLLRPWAGSGSGSWDG
eukprot:s607_g9.t1